MPQIFSRAAATARAPPPLRESNVKPRSLWQSPNRGLLRAGTVPLRHDSCDGVVFDFHPHGRVVRAVVSRTPCVKWLRKVDSVAVAGIHAERVPVLIPRSPAAGRNPHPWVRSDTRFVPGCPAAAPAQPVMPNVHT